MKQLWTQPKKNKYGNESCRCSSGHGHDSRLEAGYCDDLKALKAAGEIKDYEIQRNYRLIVNNKIVCSHRVDFVVYPNKGPMEVHETKGFATDVWDLKRKLFEALYPEIPYIVVRKGESRWQAPQKRRSTWPKRLRSLR